MKYILDDGVCFIAVQCSAVQCSAVQCSAVQCSAVQCSAVQCSAVQCSVVPCCVVLCCVVPDVVKYRGNNESSSMLWIQFQWAKCLRGKDNNGSVSASASIHTSALHQWFLG